MAAGIYTLSTPVTTAATQTTSAIIGLDGLMALSVDMQFIYGSGGTTVKSYLQFSLDGGATYQDAAAAAFATASGRKQFNLSGATPKLTPNTPGDGVLTDDTAIDGVLGPTWRVKVVSVGTYGGSSQVICRIVAR